MYPITVFFQCEINWSLMKMHCQCKVTPVFRMYCTSQATLNMKVMVVFTEMDFT